MTNDLIRRIGEHKHGEVDGYSRERGTDRLVWYEHDRDVDQAWTAGLRLEIGR